MSAGRADTDMDGAALGFVRRFARFESGLKDGGYLKSGDPGKKAEPNWDQFVRRNRTRYQPSAGAAALAALRPRQQVVGKTGLSWQPLQFAETEFELQKATLLLRLVRNNLFHGDPRDSPWHDPALLLPVLASATQLLDELAAFAGFKPLARED